MNAYELADDLAFKHIAGDDNGAYGVKLQDMLRQQADRIAELEKAYAELHHKALELGLKNPNKQTNAEPVAWMEHMPIKELNEISVRMTTCEVVAQQWGSPIPLYKAPPQREWVGLTGEDFDFLVPYCENKWDLEDYKTFAKHIEAKIRGEK